MTEKPQNTRPKTIIIVGGGTAGWLTAGLLAAKTRADGRRAFTVKVIEPESINPIGVGEGTWPSMRTTLHQIGVSETEFLKFTGASFKQGTKFVDWVHGAGEYYYHPFDRPVTSDNAAPIKSWIESGAKLPFAQYAGVQETLCEDYRAPKLLTSQDYLGVTNYGYHFEADGLSRFLKTHCQTKLSVEVIADVMSAVTTHEDGDIKAVITQDHGAIEGDIFVDCTGFRSLLLKQHYKAREISLAHIFLSDRAIVARVPYNDNAKLESTTLSTAQEAGWIWDVSLANRFGVGYVHSSAHISTDDAKQDLDIYLQNKGYEPSTLTFRELKFSANYTDKCWIRNCIGIGLSAGFVEPLEASSIMLTETAARELAHDLSAPDYDRETCAKDFNARFDARWTQVVHFLKLHYVLSEREDPFWRDSRSAEAVPETLAQDVAQWKEGYPTPGLSEGLSDGLFPEESYQFVLYGMTHRHAAGLATPELSVTSELAKYQPRLAQYMRLLPTNRDWLAKMR